MEDNSWALEKLVSIIREKDDIINKMSIEICKLRGIEPSDINTSDVRREFYIKKEE